MKKVLQILVTIISCVIALPVVAQDKLTYLDWDMLTKDTLCPLYSEVVPLESDYKLNDYQIVLEYPSWKQVEAKELPLAKRYARNISESIRINSYISVSRGIGHLNYSFIPIIKKKDKFYKLLSAKVVIKSLAKENLARTRSNSCERYVENSVLSTGKWKKIHITKDGIYKLTPKFLASLGFTDPNKVHLYGYGGHQQPEALDADKDFDDLEEVPLFLTSKGNLLFWGNGLLRWEGVNRVFNAYATKATYFLTEGENRNNIQTEQPYSGSVKQTVTSTLGHALHEVDDYAWFRGGRNLVESTLYSGAYSKTYTLSGVNSLGNEKLTVVFTGNDVATPLTIWANGASVTTRTISAPGNYMYYSEGKFANLDISDYNPGNNTWKITLATQGPIATSSRVQGRLDYIAMNYTAPLEPRDGYVRFGGGYIGTGKGSGSSTNVLKTYSGATRFTSIGKEYAGELKVMKIGKKNAPASIVSTESSNDGLTFATSDGTDIFVAFDPEYDFPEPTAGDAIENQNLHALSNVDMVIIIPTSNKLATQAQRLAEAHKQYNNLNCIVVRADQIYNEFSSGTPDATAYRRFLKMLYDRGIEEGTAPRYLLLMGDCAWDNRMKSTTWRSFSANDYLLCYQSENSYSDTQSYCWEDYCGLMDDGEGTAPMQDVSDIAIGRFPVTSEEEAKIMVDKTIAHIEKQNVAEWCNRIIVMGDDGDNNIHMKDANQVADRILESAPSVDVRKIMWDNYQRVNQGLYYSYPEIRNIVDNYIKDGAMVFNYTGHGATYLMSHERVITLDDMKSWTSDRLPLWFVAACDITPFDSQEDNLGEAAVLNPRGGGVAFIGTTRTVYSTQNFYLNRFFSSYLFDKNENGKPNSVGEALRLAKKSMVSNVSDGSQPQNKLQYALLGDPTLVFGNPNYSVVLDSINGVAINGEQFLKGGSHATISGHIESATGEIDKLFNGLVYYRLYDSKNSISTRGNTGNTPFSYTDWNQEINNGVDSVRNGRFSADIIIPKDISYSDENGRFVFYAINNERTTEANGYSEDFLVGGYSSEMETDTVGPKIFMYLNNQDFMDGDAVSAKPIFIAELYDESGIQYNGNGIGHDLQICIDGDPKKTYTLNNYFTQNAGDYKQGRVIYADMPELSVGAHWLTFRAWDMLNNTSTQTLRFVVGENIHPEILLLVLEEDIVSGQTNFHVSYDMPGLECSFMLEIYSINGDVQWRQTVNTSNGKGTVTIPWNGKNGVGAKLNNGIYICRVTASYGEGKKSHKEKKFILRGNK